MRELLKSINFSIPAKYCCKCLYSKYISRINCTNHLADRFQMVAWFHLISPAWRDCHNLYLCMRRIPWEGFETDARTWSNCDDFKEWIEKVLGFAKPKKFVSNYMPATNQVWFQKSKQRLVRIIIIIPGQ